MGIKRVLLGFNEVCFDVICSLVVESIVIALNAKAAQEEDLYDSSWQSEETLKYYLGNVLCVRIAYAWNFGGSWRLPSEIALVFVEFKQELVSYYWIDICCVYTHYPSS